MATATIGFPDCVNWVSIFSGPKVAEPISLKRMILSPSALMMMLLNSTAVVRFPTVFTVNSVLSPVIFPDGNSTF